MIGYQELTMNEPRNTRSNSLQLQVMTAVTVAFLAHAIITSGALKPVKIQQGSFPGGDFVFKLTNRDYAGAMSLSRSIMEDLGLDADSDWKDDWLYTVHLDDPSRVFGRHQRFAGGILLRDNNNNNNKNKENNKQWKKMLMKKNEENLKPVLANETHDEIDIGDLWPRLQYQSTTLPKVPAAIATFEFTNGVSSALVHTYKVFPALIKYAKEHGEKGIVPVVVTTCSIKRQLCTHYAPLAKGNKFLFGEPDTEVYLKELEAKKEQFSWSKVARYIKKVIPFGQIMFKD